MTSESHFQTEAFSHGYAQLYDHMYQDKPYAAEVDYVLSLMAASPPIVRLLDLGCGTGRHARVFSERGYYVTGVDRSPAMIARAREVLNPERSAFLCSDLSQMTVPHLQDAAVCLFHVFSYLTEKVQLELFLARLYQCLKPGAAFVFDFWYGPAVLNDQPKVRAREWQMGGTEVKRVSTPSWDQERSLIDIRIETTVQVGSQPPQTLTERHPMRYFFADEIMSLLARQGFSVAKMHAWQTTRPLTDKDWYGVVLCHKDRG